VTARIIDGTAAAAAVRARVAIAAAAFRETIGRAPGLAVVLVGDDPASSVYVRAKGKATLQAGMLGFSHRLGAGTSEAELLALISRLNSDPGVDGILVQLPLPPQIDANRVIAAIDPAKDVDGFHVANVGRLGVGAEALVPCTPLGCIHLLKTTLGELAGLDAVVIGRSNIVGKPLAMLLLAESATVTIAHSRTRDLQALVGRADIVIAAVGRPELVRGDWIKPGACVIDVGINRVDGKLVGDVAFAEVAEIAGAISPVPGGVGPMTIAMLLSNTLLAAHRRAGLSDPAVP